MAEEIEAVRDKSRKEEESHKKKVKAYKELEMDIQ